MGGPHQNTVDQQTDIQVSSVERGRKIHAEVTCLFVAAAAAAPAAARSISAVSRLLFLTCHISSVEGVVVIT